MSRRTLLALGALGLAACGGDELASAEPAPEAAVAPSTVASVTVPDGPPEACREAIRIAEQVFSYAADGMGAAADGFHAAAALDVAGLERAAADMGASGEAVEAIQPEWLAAKAGCLAP